MDYKGCPCKGCDIRLIGCHGLCPNYQKWKRELEKRRAASKEETPELSQKMKKHIWRKMMGR